MKKTVIIAVVLAALVVPDASAQMTQEMRDFIVSEHNRLRRDAVGAGGPDEVSTETATSMLQIEYDMKLECVAQAYIETQTGSFVHNTDRVADYAACGGSGSVGENWYSGAPDDALAGGATRAWVDFIWPIAWGYDDCSERQRYHGDNGCSGVTGHYTQVLWSSTYKVGCGYVPGNGVVCDYAPAGNWSGQSPFVVGEACSACPGTHPVCKDHLCATVEIFSGDFESGNTDDWSS